MKDVEKIIGEVNGTMAMEGMPLTDQDKDRLREYISSMEQEEYIRLVMPKGGSLLKIYQELSENQQESEDQEITLE